MTSSNKRATLNYEFVLKDLKTQEANSNDLALLRSKMTMLPNKGHHNWLQNISVGFLTPANRQVSKQAQLTKNLITILAHLLIKTYLDIELCLHTYHINTLWSQHKYIPQSSLSNFPSKIWVTTAQYQTQIYSKMTATFHSSRFITQQ